MMLTSKVVSDADVEPSKPLIPRNKKEVVEHQIEQNLEENPLLLDELVIDELGN